MDLDRSERIAALFAGACELSPADRRTFLDRECGEDDDLRAEVLDLLEQADRADRDGFLGARTWSGGPPGSPAEASGVPGRYEDLREHKQGGMGVVYKAWGVKLGRDVAYKVMSQAFGNDAEFRRRFAREAKITARLQYPGIVPVFELEEDGCGRPAYAMQFVEGVDIRELIRGREPAGDRASRKRLEPLLSACRIVAHAHKKGYVHGDISPRNLMIGEGGAAFVVDWGLARHVGPARSGDDVEDPGPGSAEPATPGFAAPSDLAGGPRTFVTDVYGLGAVLAALFVGVAPGGNPVIAGPGWKAVPRPLRAIIEAALADREDGPYPDAAALADDLARFLDGDKVRVDREPIRELVWRAARRHPARATVLVSSILLGAIALASAAMISEARERSARLAQEVRHSRELAREAEVFVWTGPDSFRSSSSMPGEPAFKQLLPILQMIERIAPHPKVRMLAADFIRTMPDAIRDADEANAKDTAASREFFEPKVRTTIRLMEEMARDYPQRRDIPWRWATCELILGQLQAYREVESPADAVAKALTGWISGKPPGQAKIDQALATIDKGLDRLANAQVDQMESKIFRPIQRSSWEVKACLLLQLGRYTEAMMAFDRSLTFVNRAVMPWQKMLQRACLLAAEKEQSTLPWSRRGEHARAIRMADYLAELPEVSPQAVFNAACAHALASLDPVATVAERDRRAGRAVALLTRLEARGEFRGPEPAGNLAGDKDLDPLRQRAEFQAVAAKVAKGG